MLDRPEGLRTAGTALQIARAVNSRLRPRSTSRGHTEGEGGKNAAAVDPSPLLRPQTSHAAREGELGLSARL